MRSAATAEKVRALMQALGRGARGPGRAYFTGGASAVLLGWRDATIDVDLKFDPEPPGVFDAIPGLKLALDLNIELAAPDDFIPALSDWRERSLPVERCGEIEFLHYDFRAQALAKLERGHRQDLEDVRAMLARRLVSPDVLEAAFREIEPRLARYPAIDPGVFRERLGEFLAGARP